MKRYKTPERPKSYLPRFVDPPMWMIVRFALRHNSWSFERNKVGQKLYWRTKEDAELTMSNMAQSSQEKREVRRLYKHELEEIGKDKFVLVEPVKREIIKVAKKTTSSGCLVELFEDYEARKFAIASKASTESEFLTEIAQAMGSSSSVDWNVRLREVLPLVVDMCCKYRGYKAESVFERRELVAGDLEMPSSTKNA